MYFPREKSDKKLAVSQEVTAAHSHIDKMQYCNA